MRAFARHEARRRGAVVTLSTWSASRGAFCRLRAACYPRKPYVLPQLRRLSESPFTLSRMQHWRACAPWPSKLQSLRRWASFLLFRWPRNAGSRRRNISPVANSMHPPPPPPVGMNRVFVQTHSPPFLCVLNFAQPTGSTLTEHFMRATLQVCAHVPRSFVTPFLFA